MSIIRGILIALLCALISAPAQTVAAPAQPAQTFGSVAVKGKSVNAGDKNKLGLARKRFYLFSGGIKENEALIERIKGAEITSRDCYYAQINASACLIDWLKQENCETPFCRQIEKDDIALVKEFQAAYDKGLPQYGRKPTIALDWILNNLAPNLVSGYYRQQRTSIEQILKGNKPLDSAMTTSTAALATFAKIPVGEKPAKFTISNVLPVEIGTKSYVWVCEVSVQANKQAAIILSADPANKKCLLTIRDLKACNTGTCEKK